jgi:hypothetical protein
MKDVFLDQLFNLLICRLVTFHLVPVNITDIISADGWENSFKLIVSANGTLPGPPIIVYEGQTVVIRVNNNLQSESVSIHWHGVEMKDTPWMDGPAD